MDILKLVEEIYEKKQKKEQATPKPTNQIEQDIENKPSAMAEQHPSSEKKNEAVLAAEIVEKLNEGYTFSDIEKMFNKKKLEIRVLLKSKGYQYNHLFKIWTNLSESSLLLSLKEKLDYTGTPLLNYAQKHGLHFKTLETKLKSIAEDTFIPLTRQKETEAVSNKVDINSQGPTIQPSSMSNQLNSYFSVDDLLVLKSLISERRDPQASKRAFSVYLEETTARKLENYSSKVDRSISSIIEELLQSLLKEPKGS
jgi:hypothetical protein